MVEGEEAAITQAHEDGRRVSTLPAAGVAQRREIPAPPYRVQAQFQVAA